MAAQPVRMCRGQNGGSHLLSCFVSGEASQPSPSPSARKGTAPLFLPSTVTHVLRRAVAARFHVGVGLAGGPRLAGPGPAPLLLFPGGGILSSVSFQTFRDHTALFKPPGGGPRVPRPISRTRPLSRDAGQVLQTWVSKSRHLWRPVAQGNS